MQRMKNPQRHIVKMAEVKSEFYVFVFLPVCKWARLYPEEEMSPADTHSVINDERKREEEDEDDLPEEQSCNSTRPKQPSAVLREINPEDGTEVIISDHTTSSAFVFQNSLLYELD